MDFSKQQSKVGTLASFGGLIAGLLASTCCILPVAVVLVGLGSVGLAAAFEPYRIPLIILTYLFLGIGFYFNYRKPSCAVGDDCRVPKHIKRTRIVLWVATAVATLSILFPHYINWFF